MVGSPRICCTSGFCMDLFLLSSGSSDSTHVCIPSFASWRKGCGEVTGIGVWRGDRDRGVER